MCFGMKLKKLKKKYRLRSLPQDQRLYKLPIPIIGITGGIASGKSLLLRLLALENRPTLSADYLVKQIYHSPMGRDYLHKNFPGAINEDTTINFKFLRETFFQSHESKKNIEQMIYSQLPTMFMLNYYQLKSPKYLFYEVPLLFEKKLEQYFDWIICTHVSDEVQIQRLVNRDHISLDLANTIVKEQLPKEDKFKQSHFILMNNGDEEDFKMAWSKIKKEIFY